MSNAIAQSTSPLAVSPTGEDSYDFIASVQRAANRTAKGITRERLLLDFNKLTSAVCADYRAHFASIYGKTDRLPSDIYTKIQDEVTLFIEKQLKRVNVTNVIGFRRAFFHKSNDMEIVERVQSTGENKLTLEEQKFGVLTFITAAEKRLKELEAKPTPDYDREKAVKQQIMKLRLTEQFILGEIAHQEKLKQEASKVKVS